MKTARAQARHRQRGIALISALLLLVVVTIMAISMFRSYGMQERIAGNTREKQRALNAAESAQQYAEDWLLRNPAAVAGVCIGPVGTLVGQVCSNLLANPVALPWVARVNYTEFTSYLINGKSNVLSATGGIGTYVAAPAFYISYLGTPAGGTGDLYQINAVGYGGSATAVAVVESTYLITTNSAKSPDK